MFSTSPYLPNTRSSSFLIRDILGSEVALNTVGDKYGTFEQTLGSSLGAGQMMAGSGFSGSKELGYYQTPLGYHDMKRGTLINEDEAVGYFT